MCPEAEGCSNDCFLPSCSLLCGTRSHCLYSYILEVSDIEYVHGLRNSINMFILIRLRG